MQPIGLWATKHNAQHKPNLVFTQPNYNRLQVQEGENWCRETNTSVELTRASHQLWCGIMEPISRIGHWIGVHLWLACSKTEAHPASRKARVGRSSNVFVRLLLGLVHFFFLLFSLFYFLFIFQNVIFIFEINNLVFKKITPHLSVSVQCKSFFARF